MKKLVYMYGSLNHVDESAFSAEIQTRLYECRDKILAKMDEMVLNACYWGSGK